MSYDGPRKRVGGRFAQAHKEALFSVALAGLYFLWWYVTAYGLGSGPVEEYGYYFGLPSWFFFSCVLGLALFTCLAWLMVAKLFREVPLDDGEDDGGDL